MHRDRGGNLADMRHQLGLVVSASIPRVTSLRVWASNLRADFEATRGVIESSRQGKATS